MSSPSPSANPSTSTAAASPAGADDAPGVDQEALVYLASLLVLALITALFIVRIPRIFARLSRWSEWSQGHFLRNVSFNGSPRIVHDRRPSGGSPGDDSSDESHTYFQDGTHIQRLDEKGGPAAMEYPTHTPSCPAFLRGFSSKLSTRLFPGYSLAQVICALVYLACWIYPTLYKSNPFSDPERTGWVGIAQVPFIFAFAGKNNALGPFLGMGYEKVCTVL